MKLAPHISRILSSTAVFTALLSPLTTFAAGATFFGPLVPAGCKCPGSAPDFGCVLQVFQNVINFAVSFGVILIVIIIAYAGAMMVIYSTNAGKRSAGRKALYEAVVGLVILLCSWLIVDFVMKAIYDDKGSFGPWNGILSANRQAICIDPNLNPVAITEGGLNPGTGSSSVVPGRSVGGSCSVASRGACDPAILQTTCFGRRAQEASKICNVESAGGRPDIESGTDRLDSGSGPSYSIGIWQINLTTTQLQTPTGTLNCPAAFTKKCGRSYGTIVGPSNRAYCTSSVSDQRLYEACKTAAKRPDVNTTAACKLYNQQGANGGFQPWAFSANKCSISKR